MKKLPLWLANLSKATDMTTGDVMRTVTSFAIPVMIGSLFRLIDPPEDIMDGAISTFAAQNYGKGVKKSMLIPVLISLGLTGFIFLFGKYFMLLFVGAEETGILEPSLLYMRITSIF